MKYHKIRNVEKSTCTLEQLVAYNLAKDDRDYLLKQYDQTAPEFVKSEFIQNAVQAIMRSASRTADYTTFCTRVNIDAVFCALNAGLRPYLEANGSGILWDYTAIGKMFPANYLQ